MNSTLLTLARGQRPRRIKNSASAAPPVIADISRAAPILEAARTFARPLLHGDPAAAALKKKLLASLGVGWFGRHPGTTLGLGVGAGTAAALSQELPPDHTIGDKIDSALGTGRDWIKEHPSLALGGAGLGAGVLATLLAQKIQQKRRPQPEWAV